MIHAYAATAPAAQLTPYDYDPGPLGEGEVELEVLHCGVCHSDLSVIDDAWGNARYPVVAGHEVVGRVASVGARVTSVAVGQVVGLGWHAGYCDHCKDCEAGDNNFCATGQATIVGHHGGFADRVRAAANAVVAIPEGMDLVSAGPLFCGGITVFNPLLQFDVKPTDRVAVIGIGGLGHMALMFLNAWGCDVTAFTSSPDKREDALSLGAHHTLDSRDPAALKAAARTFDLIISTVNVALDWNAYLGTLTPRGRLHLVGAALDPLDIKAFNLIGRQRTVSGSPVGSPASIATMLDFALLHDIRPKVEVFPMAEVNAAIAHLRSGQARYRVVLSRET